MIASENISDSVAFARLPESERVRVLLWQSTLTQVLPPLAPSLTRAAQTLGVSVATARRAYYALRHADGHWSALVNRSKAPSFAPQRLPEPFLDYLQTLAETYQRNTRAAFRELKRRWMDRMEIPGYESLPGWPALPRGWSERNFYRVLKARPGWRFGVAMARRGPSAAASERPLVLTTRRELWVGSHYLFDDVWHDHFVADGSAIGRPLDLGCLDYYSACYFARGGKIRQEGAQAVLESEMRLLLVYVLTQHGYSPRGTQLVAENATAAIREDVESTLRDMTGGLITVSRSGISSTRARASHQWGASGGGNPRHKAALESFHNLLHNELADLAAQSGLSRDTRPEQTAGLLKYTNGILAAAAQLPADRAAQLQLPILTRSQWECLIEERLHRINARTDHQIEGWDGLSTIDPISLRERRLSPLEVWNHGRTDLTPLHDSIAASILYRDLTREMRIRRRIVETSVSEVSGDALLYDAHALGLPDGEIVAAVVNPFDISRLWCYDSRGRWIGNMPRLHRVSRGDADALHREIGRVEKIHSDLIAPFRQRHAADTRKRLQLIEHNNRVLSGTTADDQSHATLSHQAEQSLARLALQPHPKQGPRQYADTDDSY